MPYINFECRICSFKKELFTTVVNRGYNRSIIRALWCDYCKAPQVIKYKFNDVNEVEIIDYPLVSPLYFPVGYKEEYTEQKEDNFVTKIRKDEIVIETEDI